MPTTCFRIAAALIGGAVFASLALADAPGAPPPPPPGAPALGPATTDTPDWYVADGSTTKGPFALAALKAMARQGQIKPDTQIFHAGAWHAARDVAELQDVIVASNGAPPPPAPPQAGDVQKQLNDKAQAFLVGTWRSESDTAMNGTSFHNIVVLTYRPDGGLAGTFTTEMPGYSGYQPPPAVRPLEGRYTVTGIDAQTFSVTAYFQGQGSSTISVRIADQNTLESTTDGSRSYRQ